MAEKQVRNFFYSKGCLLRSRHLKTSNNVSHRIKVDSNKTIITWQPQNENWKIWSCRLLVDLRRNNSLMLLATASLVGGRVPPVTRGFHFGQPPPITNREFTQRRRRRQRERQKSNRFWQAKQQLCRCITFFDTFLCLRCTTTTWNCLISRLVEDGNKDNNSLFLFRNFDGVL